jgi:hypothetical protein
VTPAIAASGFGDDAPHASSSRVVLPAGHPARYSCPGAGTFEIEAAGQSGRWRFYTAQLAAASGRSDPRAIMRLATSAGRMALLLELGTWTTGSGRVIHPDRDNGLCAEPFQSPARVRVTAPMVAGSSSLPDSPSISPVPKGSSSQGSQTAGSGSSPRRPGR